MKIVLEVDDVAVLPLEILFDVDNRFAILLLLMGALVPSEFVSSNSNTGKSCDDSLSKIVRSRECLVAQVADVGAFLRVRTYMSKISAQVSQESSTKHLQFRDA